MELEINGQEFQLNNSDREGSYAKSSPIGDVKLVKVLHNPSNENKDKIMIKINGKYIKKDGKRIYLVEGNKYNIGKNTITVNKISGSRRDIPIVHRVVEKNKDFLETKGDANPGQLEFEKHVKPEQIYGTILFRIPKIGLFKITTMDLLGLNGGKFLKLDTLPSC